MQTQELCQRQRQQPLACAAGPDSFGVAFAALKKAWEVESRYNPFFPFVTWTWSGPKLGASTLLVRKVVGDEARLLALLSVASGLAIPTSALKHLVAAEREFNRGDPMKSGRHVRMAGIPALRSRESARLLYVAAGLLDQGCVLPIDLMKACELDCAPLQAIKGQFLAPTPLKG
jgi:hypothetical protein